MVATITSAPRSRSIWYELEAVGRIGEEDVPPETRDGLVAAFREFKRAP